MFRRALEVKCSWKVDQKVKSRLDCGVSKQGPRAREVERSDDADSRIADGGGRDQAENEDRSTYKYVFIEGCPYHLGTVVYETKVEKSYALS